MCKICLYYRFSRVDNYFFVLTNENSLQGDINFGVALLFSGFRYVVVFTFKMKVNSLSVSIIPKRNKIYLPIANVEHMSVCSQV